MDLLLILSPINLSEFELYDGEAFITFNIVSINTEKCEIVVAVRKAFKRHFVLQQERQADYNRNCLYS